MKKCYLICDESGAKGYSDVKESFPGEIGVIAGYLVPEDIIDSVRKELEEIKKDAFADSKIHIAELPRERQEHLRSNIIDFIIKNNFVCVYDAIHVEGFNAIHEKMNEELKKLQDENVSTIKSSEIKYKESLHAKLFEGIFCDAVAWCLENIGDKFFLQIISDTIDSKYIKYFERVAKEFLMPNKVEPYTREGFNPETHKREKAIMKLGFDNKSYLNDFTGIEHSIHIEDSGLTLAADVIANSINHHFRERDNITIGERLKTKEAMEGHPLQSNIYGFPLPSEMDSPSDILYMHEKLRT